jgi:hypothetical protein
MILKGTEQDTVTIHTERKIKRKRGKYGEGRVQIVTESEDKTYRMSFLNRRRLQDNTSVPFVYIKPASHPVGSSLHVGHLKSKHPFTYIVAGSTGSGKISFCIKLLQNLYTLCTESSFKGGIICCYSEATAVPREQLS